MILKTLALAAAAAAVALLGAEARAGDEAPPPLRQEAATKLVLDFEDASIWTSENASPFEVSTEHATQGPKSLKVNYTNKPEWSNIITKSLPGDWSGYRYLSLDVWLAGELPASLGMWARDKALHKAETSWPIGPGANTVTVDLDELQRTAELDRSQVIALCLYKETKEEITVHLDNMRLSNEKPVVVAEKPVRMPDNELLSNAGFEELKQPDALGSPFAWWEARRWSGPSFIGRGEAGVYTGTSSLMLDGRGPCKIGVYSPPIKIQSPTKLRLSAYVQTDSLEKGAYGACASLTITDYGERGLPGGTAEIPAGSSGWRKVELVCDVPAKTPAVKVFVQLHGKGRLWVDDVSLAGVDLATPAGVSFTATGRKLLADPPLVSEHPKTLKRRERALAAMEELKAAVKEASAKGVETVYDEIPLLLGKLAFEVRWDLPEHLALRDGYADCVTERCEAATRHLRLVMAGKLPDLKVPPHPDFAKLSRRGAYFCEGESPRILFSMQYHSKGELTRWFCPGAYDGSIPAVGASRFDVQSTPVWEAYQKYPETHRVYDDGWCGHIIRDKYSAGGEGRCVISLDSPRMLEAVSRSIAAYAGKLKGRTPPPLFVNMGFEYSYVNYDKFSEEKYRNWLAAKYRDVKALNAAWKTSLKGFSEVTVPSFDPARPETNPARYYDWGEFNLWRFTDFMRWAKAEMRKSLPDAATTTGGGEPFGSGFWKQGVDEEGLALAGITDLWLSETGSRALGITSVMDLQRSLKSDMPILDPEYHALPNTCFLMFLHGCAVMDYWWWPDEAGEFYESSMKHSHTRTLRDVEVVLRTALDVRRLPGEIASFSSERPEVALLYPRASLVQSFPGAQGNKTPFSFEVERTYEAAVRLDAPIGFVSSRMAREGALDGVKLLVVPGCRYVEPDVFDKMAAWVEAGGVAVITPTSLVADEYSRRRDYLFRLGIEITSEELPEYLAGDAARGIDQPAGELDFIQGPVAKTVVSAEPKRSIRATRAAAKARRVPEAMEAAGIIQAVKASSDWKVLATHAEDGSPAVLARELGKGEVYYLASQPTVASRRELLDLLMSRRSVKRPIRVFTEGWMGIGGGGYPEGVESRTARADGAYLTYLANTTGNPVKVALSAGRRFAAFFDCNAGLAIDGPAMVLEPYETRIVKVTLK